MAGVARLIYATMTRYDAEVREYTALWEWENQSPLEMGVTAILASGLPQLGSAYVAGSEFDTFATCVGYSNIAPKSWEDSRLVWRANVNYSTDSNKQRRPAQNSDNPIDKPAIISTRGHRKHITAKQTNFGAPIVNTAGGSLPDDQLQVEDSDLVLTITKNHANISLQTLIEYTDSINASTFFQQPKHTWKMEPPRVQLVYHGNTPYFTVTYEFRNKKDDWRLKPRNMGTYDLNADLAAMVSSLDGRYQDLDADGNFAAIPYYYDGTNGLDPVEYYPAKNFGALSIPTDFPT